MQIEFVIILAQVCAIFYILIKRNTRKKPSGFLCHVHTEENLRKQFRSRKKP